MKGCLAGRIELRDDQGGGGALISWRGGYDQLGWSDDELARATGLSPSNSRR